MPVLAHGVTPEPPSQPEGLPAAALWRPELWRFHLYGLHGDGTQELIAPDVPVQGPQVTTALNGTDQITGTFSPEIVPALVDEYGPLVETYGTAVLATFEDQILAMCIVDDDPIQDQGLSFTSSGFANYLNGMPYRNVKSYIQADPADIIRHMWSHVQSYDGFDLGLRVDGLSTPRRVGEPKSKDDDGNDVDAQPVTLAWYETDDLSQVFTQQASDNDIDWWEEHDWTGPGYADIGHRLRLAYPKAGRRRHDLQFAAGVNLRLVPSVDSGEYASQVLMLGAGEGGDMLRRWADTPYRPYPKRTWRRVGRVAVVDDKSLATKAKVGKAAEAEAAWRGGGQDIQTVTVFDHEAAPFGSWANGDEIRVTGKDLPWSGDLDLWVRVLSTSYKRDDGTAELTVVSAGRTDRGN